MSLDTIPNPSKKDVIYIDIEDDITSIIDKVKSAKAPIVALVPPKRIGVLQSVVNLKLLNRAANSSDKRVVLITSDSALTSLAAGIAIPIAKNLQSKPEVPEVVTADGDDEEIIDGTDLPVGDLATTASLGSVNSADSTKPDAKPSKLTQASAMPFAAGKALKRAGKSSNKLPDFDSFRKKLFLGIGGGVLLVAFLIWAFVFAPHATIAITANTNLQNIDQILQLKPGATADPAQNLVPANVQQLKKSTSVDFDPTGKKDVGDKSTGQLALSNNSFTAKTIDQGAALTSSSGIAFTTDSSVTVPAGTFPCGNFSCPTPGSATLNITAVESGSKNNGASGSVDGLPSSVSGTFKNPSGGGTDKTVTVVSGDDIAKAREQLQSQDASAARAELKKKFGSDTVLINESFKAEAGDPVSSPKVGEEAPGKAKLTAETTYTLVAVKRSDLKVNFDVYLKKQLAGQENQKVYASGEEGASFSQFAGTEGGYVAKVTAQAQIGPVLNDSELKKQLAGKRSGEIQQQLEIIDGIEDVETSFFPFWVTTAPNEDKITIKFVLKSE